MEDRKLNEKESLELIAQMIRNTRRNLDAGKQTILLLNRRKHVLVVGICRGSGYAGRTGCVVSDGKCRRLVGLLGFAGSGVAAVLVVRAQVEEGTESEGLYRSCSETGVADYRHCLLRSGWVCYALSQL